MTFVRERLFDDSMPIDEFLREMNLRLRAYEEAAERLLALLEAQR
jgi:hypothetical protein